MWQGLRDGGGEGVFIKCYWSEANDEDSPKWRENLEALRKPNNINFTFQCGNMTAFERLKAILILVNIAALLFSDWLGGSSDESMLIPGDPGLCARLMRHRVNRGRRQGWRNSVGKECKERREFFNLGYFSTLFVGGAANWPFESPDQKQYWGSGGEKFKFN